MAGDNGAVTLKGENQLADILARLSLAQGHEEEEEIGRSDLASLIFHAPSELLEQVLVAAKRNDRLRRSLAAARYYSGLSQAKCDQIDNFLQAPLPSARRPKL